MDSMPVRDKGFELVLKGYPREQLDLLMKYHRMNGGLSRYVKFRYFFEQVRGESITEQQVMTLSATFSELMRKELTNASLLILDSLDFVKRRHAECPMHIVSGSDGEELRYLCAELGIAKYFRSIHGSPTPKKQLVQSVIQGCDPDACVLIGDFINDFDAAVANGIHFAGYNNPALIALSPNYIESFATF
jgi:phosphoglycolate phosphatase-like HAD superfamily hydrolase